MESSLIDIHSLHEQLEEVVLLEVLLKPRSNDWKEQFIPGAQLISMKTMFHDADSDLPNTLPSPEQFRRDAELLGISSDSTVILYEAESIYASPRLWYLFRAMGHEKVYILNGGIASWRAAGYRTQTDVLLSKTSGSFDTEFQPSFFRDLNDITNRSTDNCSVLLDARSAGRFNNEAPDPRPYLPSGAIPASVNLPYTEVLEHGFFKPKQALRNIFEQFESDRPWIFTCGSGITACIILLAAHESGYKELSLYDGSWTEYATKILGASKPKMDK